MNDVIQKANASSLNHAPPGHSHARGPSNTGSDYYLALILKAGWGDLGQIISAIEDLAERHNAVLVTARRSWVRLAVTDWERVTRSGKAASATDDGSHHRSGLNVEGHR